MSGQETWRVDLRQKFESFCDSPANHENLGALGRYLASTPEREASSNILPLEEMEERLKLVAELEKYWEEAFSDLTHQDSKEWKPFSNHQIAALMVISLDRLRTALTSPADAIALLEILQKIPCLTKLFLTKPPNRDDLGTLELMSPTPTPSEVKKRRRSSESFGDDGSEERTLLDQHGNAKRNIKQVEKRLKLDQNSCIILKTGDPDVCHIIPFSANAREDKRKLLQRCFQSSLSRLLEGNLFEKEKQARELFTSKVGVSDKAWNLVSLERQLHTWWGNFYFGLECLGTISVSEKPDEIATLKLKFHWMPRRAKPLDPLGRTKQEFLGMFRETYGNPSSGNPVFAAARPVSGRHIRTGDIFYVDIQTRHVHKMKLAFDIQWALIKIAAMAGGAEALELVGDEPEYLDEYGRFPESTGGWQMAMEELYGGEDPLEASEVGSGRDEFPIDDAKADRGKGKTVDLGKVKNPGEEETITVVPGVESVPGVKDERGNDKEDGDKKDGDAQGGDKQDGGKKGGDKQDGDKQGDDKAGNSGGGFRSV